jgi:hypothetical protein
MKRIASLVLTFAMIVAGLAPAKAQGLVTTTPYQATSVVGSGSVAVTNTFQSVLASSATRRGCRLQNTSANTIYVYVGAIAGATTAQSLQLTTKGSFDCASGGIVITDQISVTGTAGDTFVTVRQ